MRLWLSRRIRSRIDREIREAETARQKAREHQSRAGDRTAEVNRLIAQLARHRNAGRMADRIRTAAAMSIVEQLSQYSRDLRDEAGRTQNNR